MDVDTSHLTEMQTLLQSVCRGGLSICILVRPQVGLLLAGERAGFRSPVHWTTGL